MSADKQTETPAVNDQPKASLMKPYLLHCPGCNETQAKFALFLGNLGDCDEMQCQECERVTSLEDVKSLIECWSTFLAWLALLPAGKS